MVHLLQVAIDTEQLQRDKDELLRQVVALREEVSVCGEERERLSERVEGLEREKVERDAHCRALFEELKAAKATIEARQG